MSLEIKLGGDEMGFWKKKKVDENVSSEIENPQRRALLKTGLALGAGAIASKAIPYLDAVGLGASDTQAGDFKLPGAIAADPDWAVHDAWGAMKTGTGHSLYNLYGKDYAIAVLKLDSNANVGTQFKKVDELTMQTSHAYYMATVKLDRCGKWLFTHYVKDNLGLELYARGYISMMDKNYNKSKKQTAHGIFAATSVGANEFRDAKAKSEKFMNASVTDKEIMLRQEFAKFSKTKANPANRDVNSMEYKLRSAYYNLGMYIMSGFESGDKDISNLWDRNGNGIYSQLKKKFGFSTVSSTLL